MTVAIGGEVDRADVTMLRGVLLDLVDGQGNLSVVLDLSELTFIDSAGLALLLEMHGRAVERGGTIAVRNVRPSTARTFEVVGLHHILTIS